MVATADRYLYWNSEVTHLRLWLICLYTHSMLIISIMLFLTGWSEWMLIICDLLVWACNDPDVFHKHCISAYSVNGEPYFLCSNRINSHCMDAEFPLFRKTIRANVKSSLDNDNERGLQLATTTHCCKWRQMLFVISRQYLKWVFVWAVNSTRNDWQWDIEPTPARTHCTEVTLN